MSFRLKTILGIALIEGILLLLLIVMGINLIHSSQEAELEKRATAIATLFATTTKDSVLSSDLASLESFADEVMKNPDIVYARVLDQDGLVMAERGDIEVLKRYFKADEKAHDAKELDGVFDTQAKIDVDGKIYGQVQVGLSLSSVNELLDQAKSNALALALLEMCLVALFSFVLGTWLTRQIKALQIGAELITRGEFGYQVKVHGHDELARTSNAFNVMSLRVKNLYDELSDVNSKLEENISEIVRSNMRLATNEKYLSSVFNAMAEGLVVIDENGIIHDFNPAAEGIFGYAHEEAIGHNISMLMPEPDRGQHDTYMNNYVETGKTKVIGIGREVNGMRKDGSVFPMELAVSVAVSEGVHKNYTGIIRDISQRRQAEAALVLQHQQLDTIQRAQAGFIAGGNAVEFFEGLLPDILELSESEFGLIGEAMQDENGEPYLKAYALSNIAWDESTRKFYEGSAPQGLEFRGLDNLFGKVILSGKPVISNDPIHDPHAKGIPPGHPPLNAFLGLPVFLGGQLMGMVGVANRPGGYDEEVIEHLQPILSTCAQLFDALSKERDRQKNLEQLQEEVTARQRAQAELKLLNETLEQRVSERTNEQQLLYLVTSILANTETPLDEVFNDILHAVLPSLSDKMKMCTRMIVDDTCYQTTDFQEGQRTKSFPIIVNEQQRGNIEIVFLEEWQPGEAESFEKNKEPLVKAISQEVGNAIERRLSLEERQSMEIQLRQAQKLESVGQLAAGVAHEINTPTQFVSDNTHFLRDAVADITQLLKSYEDMAVVAANGPVPTSQLEELKALAEELDIDFLKNEVPLAIEQSLDGLQRIVKIVQAMKEFSHPGTNEKTLHDINRAIETTIDVSRNEWKYHADLIKELDPKLPLVPMLPGEFNQVMLNLIVNAAHAIPEASGEGTNKGEIVVATRRSGDWVVITVSDNGAGIPDKIKNRIFDPFFTTKEVGKGSGQGLAIAWSVIVDKHGGTLSVESQKDVGTTFTIHLPIMENVDAKREES